MSVKSWAAECRTARHKGAKASYCVLIEGTVSTHWAASVSVLDSNVPLPAWADQQTQHDNQP